MRIHRLQLKHFRAIEACDLEFQVDGLNVISGPNEAGKSSLREALFLLLEIKDNSKAQGTQAVQPAGKDVATEIEAELETGPYRFLFRKRFHRKPATELHLITPKREQLSGRDAHDRVQAILKETLDFPLWKALLFKQGEGQAKIGASPTLLAALDRSGARTGAGRGSESPQSSGELFADETDGGDGSDGHDALCESIFEAAHGEFLRYFTPKGKQNKELLEQEKMVRAAAEEVERLSAELAKIEQDAERSTQLAQTFREQSQRQAAAALELEQARLDYEQARRLEPLVQAARAESEKAQSDYSNAEQRLREREALNAKLKELASKLERAQVESAEWEAQANVLTEQVKAQADSTKQLKEQRAAVQKRVERAQETCAHLREKAELESLIQKRDRHDAAQESFNSVKADLAGLQISPGDLSFLREAQNQVGVAQGLIEAVSPEVRLRSVRELEVMLDGESTHLQAGREESRLVEGELSIETSEGLRVSVRAGRNAEEAAKRLHEAEARVRERCRSLGLADLAQAEERMERKQQLESESRRLGALLEETHWNAECKQRAEVLAERIRERSQSRGDLADCDLGEAVALLESSEAELAAIAAQCEESARVENKLQAELAVMAERRSGARKRVEEFSHELDQATADLAAQRERIGDAELASKVEQAQALKSAKANALDELLLQLQSSGLEAKAQALSSLETKLKEWTRELAASERERGEVDARLELRGGMGLGEVLESARGEERRRMGELQRKTQRAEAARLLYESLNEEREKARSSYARPLAERIDALGRSIFGDSFAVELGPELEIARRSLNGISLDLDQLSTGTREQLAILSRLACAELVARDGAGVPLILDDALGASDPERTQRMTQLLAEAGDGKQILLLCPDSDQLKWPQGVKRIAMSVQSPR